MTSPFVTRDRRRGGVPCPTRELLLSRMNRPTNSGRLRAASLAVLACLLLIPSTAASARRSSPAQSTPTTTLPPTLEDGDNPQLGAEYNDVLREEKKLQEDLRRDQD